MPESIDTTVRRLADLEAIRDLARRYAHYVWRMDIRALVDLFAEDGEMDAGDRPAIKGKAQLREGFELMLRAGVMMPFIQQHVIDVAGDTATGACYIDLRATLGGQSMIGGGCYEDRYVRTPDGWRFAARKVGLRFFVPVQQGWAT